MTSKTTLKDIFLNIFHTALLCLLSVLRVVDVSFVLIIMLDVFQMDDHVQGVGQNEEQDERGDEAHEDGWRQESSAVTRRRKFTSSDVEGLNLKRGKRFLDGHSGWLQNHVCLLSALFTLCSYVINLPINSDVFLLVCCLK